VNRASLLVVGAAEAEGARAPAALRLSLQCTWALLCGFLAAGIYPADRAAMVRLAALWLLADAMWGYILAQLVALKLCALESTASPEEQATTSSGSPHPAFRIAPPYTVPGSPAARLAGWMGHVAGRFRDGLSGHVLAHGLAAFLAGSLALVVATYLGRVPLVLVSGGLVLALCVTIVSGRNIAVTKGWLAGLHVALAWALGYVALAPLNPLALGLAALVGVGVLARVRLAQSDWAVFRWLFAAVQVFGIGLLLLQKQPVLAAAVAMLTLGERMSQDMWRGRLAWVLEMALLALGARYWT